MRHHFLAILCLAVGVAQAEPSAEALATQLDSADVKVRREAIYQLGKLGPAAKAALPALLKMTDDPDKQVWSGALGVIADLGPAASDAVPQLIEGLDSRKVKGGRERDRNQALLRTAYALGQIGPAAVPALAVALEGDNTPRRFGAARALAQMGSAAKEATPALLKNLTHDDDLLRREVVEALGQIGAAAVPGLIDALGGSKPKQRQAAAQALGLIGAGAKAAAPALLTAAEKETDDLARGAVLGALTKTGVEPAKTTPLLLKAIRSENAELRHAGLNALLGSRETAAKAVTTIVKDLDATDAGARRKAAELLGRLGAAAMPAVPALIKRAQAEPAEAAYADALAQVGPLALPSLLEALSQGKGDRKWVFRALNEMGAPAMAGLTEALRSPTPSIRAGAATALEGMPLEKHPAVKLLLELTADKEAPVRAAALRTLAEVRSQKAVVVAKLEAALEDRDPGVQKAAAIGLATAGAVEKVGVNGLASLLTEPDLNTRKAAVQSLGGLGERAKPALPALLKAMAEPALTPFVIETIGRIGPAAADAVPGLLAYAKIGDDSSRSAAYAALGSIGPASQAALPVLYEALRSPSQELQLVSLHAIARIEKDDAKLFGLLTDRLKERSGRMRRGAAEEFKRLGERSQHAQAAVPLLVTMLDTPTERSESINALRSIRPTDVALLQRLLEHKEPTVRAYACEGLGKLGAQAAPAIAKLQDRQQHDSEERVRQQAKKAIGAIEKK